MKLVQHAFNKANDLVFPKYFKKDTSVTGKLFTLKASANRTFMLITHMSAWAINNQYFSDVGSTATFPVQLSCIQHSTVNLELQSPWKCLF